MRILNRVAFALMLLPAVSPLAFAQFQFPKSGGAVSDMAEKLTPTTMLRLTDTVTDFRGSTGIDFRVVTIPISELRGRPIEEYSIRLARRWEVGRDFGSRGLLMVIAIGPRDKSGNYHGATRLEISRNLERNIPNRVASEVTHKMRDSLKEGWFDAAVTIGVGEVVTSFDRAPVVAGQSSAAGSAPPQAAAPKSPGISVGQHSIDWGTATAFGIVSTLLFLAVPAVIIAAIVRIVVSGPGRRAGGGTWNRRMNRSGGSVGIVTGIASRSSNWSDPTWSGNSASIDASSTDWTNSTSSSSFDDSSSSSSSSSSSNDFSGGSSSSSDGWGSSSGDSTSSSSSSNDSSGSSSSSSDFGGGGSTDSW